MLIRRGTVKPPIGRSTVNWDHPFVRSLLFGLWLNHPSSRHVTGTTAGTPEDVVPTFGSIPPRQVTTVSGGALQSNSQGSCLRMLESHYIDVGADPFPANNVSICLVRMKTDGTNRNPGFGFSNFNDLSFDRRVTASMPFSDGTTYWDFAGVSAGTTRLSIGGLSYSTTIPERWVFTAGARGMAIWFNGRKVASHTTANPGRNLSGAGNFRINDSRASSSGDRIDLNFFMGLSEQWDDALCAWWSAEPYAHLYPDPLKIYGFQSSAAAPTRSQTFIIGG